MIEMTRGNKVLINELKYAVLGSVLMVVFLLPWSTSLIRSIFPGAKGPANVIYKMILFVGIFYIIQKTEWFQHAEDRIDLKSLK